MIATLQAKWDAILQSRKGRKIIRIIRVTLVLLILGYLGYKLYQLGWRTILNNLPGKPLFYVFFILLYFSIPVTEVYIYLLFWNFHPLKSLPVFIKKRILNTDFLGYSGEVYFFGWAHNHINETEVHIAETIRDNNIISSAASTTITIIILIIFLNIGYSGITDYIHKLDSRYFILTGIVLVILIPILFRFKKYIFSTPLDKTLKIYGIQLLRMLIGQVLQIAQWAIVLPMVSFSTWITYAALAILIARVPFPSNKQLIFMGIGVEVASKLGIPEASMFGLLGMIVALNKIFNFVLYFILSISMRNEGDIPNKRFPINKSLERNNENHSMINSD